jgi:hypothetical protein
LAIEPSGAGSRTLFIASIACWLVILAGALAVGALVWGSRGWPLVHDAPLMHYVAWRIGRGAVPYRDLFDMNFPGVYVLHLFVVRGLGAGDVAWRVFDLGWLSLTAVLIGMFVGSWGRLAAVGAGVMFALYHLAGGAWQAGQRDFLLCAFLLAGALGVARWLESAAGARAHVALLGGGLALGAAITIKPHAIVLAAGLATLVVFASLRARGTIAAGRAGRGVAARGAGDGPLASLTVFSAGVVTAPAAVLAWLGAAGALPAWRAIVLEYLVPLYSRLGRGSGWSVYRPEAWIALGAGVVLTLASVLVARRFSARHAVAALGVLYGVVHFAAQGKGWEYHLYPLAAFAIVLLFAELEPALARRRWPVAIPLALAVVAGGGLLASKAADASAAGWERAKADRVRGLAGELAARLTPGDTVQVLDTTGGGIHALLRLGVVEPTRFIYDFHFFHDTSAPAIRALREELVRGLAARPPRLIVLFEESWPAGGYERVDAFIALRERLAGYDLVRPGPGYRIYAQRDRS